MNNSVLYIYDTNALKGNGSLYNNVDWVYSSVVTFPPIIIIILVTTIEEQHIIYYILIIIHFIHK